MSAFAQTVAVADGTPEQTASPAVTHNFWTAGAPLPIAVTYQTTGVIAGKIYNVGGHSTKVIGSNQIYNPVTDAWTTGAPLPTPTLNAASAVVGSVLYIFGGSTTDGITNEVWAYNSKTNTWATKAAMPTARQGAVAVAENNIIYVIGGDNSSKTRLSTVESYNPATND
ncbi:MAG: kelch repeat-containing protein [Terriglobales bacterium]